ncbi:hypothetical protein E2562_012115 [Oryza meyeriana var. granulata]|uniref:Uncharacterized protein n=1 Tax=Oryza meyeriana var. granulata TaxID=110450 RepID=A0A6G1F770_9ORYZ|nr:hypothetical protein E2562_012115 [Oryza meyeriana var. granulata]
MRGDERRREGSGLSTASSPTSSAQVGCVTKAREEESRKRVHKALEAQPNPDKLQTFVNNSGKIKDLKGKSFRPILFNKGLAKLSF